MNFKIEKLAKINTIVSEIQLSYKSKIDITQRPTITSSQDAVNILHAAWDEDLLLKEAFYAIFLNRANKVQSVLKVSTGSTTACTIDLKFVVVSAVKQNSSGVILAHNHPSCNLNPSQADIQITKKAESILDYLDIKVIDHVIITHDANKYFSFAEESLI